MPGSNRTASGVLGGLLGLIGLSAVAGILVTATVTPAIAVAGAATSSSIKLFDSLPDYLEIGDLMLPSTLYARNTKSGEWEAKTTFYEQNRSPVTKDQIAPVVFDAILSSEDPHFYDHGGVDLMGTARAVFNTIVLKKKQGGSSISQQYVKNVIVQKCVREAQTSEEETQCYNEAIANEGTEGVQRKLQEMRYAIALEKRYDKAEILVSYLNIAHFGGTVYGIDAAARYYFNVPASKLDIGQAAALAGMVQTPSLFRLDMPKSKENGEENGYALTKERQKYVLTQMLKYGKITQAQYREAWEAPLKPKITPPRSGCGAMGDNGYFCQYVINTIRNDPAFGETPEARAKLLSRGGLQIYMTVDWRIQDAAIESMKKRTPEKVDKMDFGSTAVSVEAGTGRILAIAQNTKFSQDPAKLKDRAYSPIVYAGDQLTGGSNGFQIGSTFKLFTLLDWLEKGHSVNQRLDGRLRAIKRFTNSCWGDWVNTRGKAPSQNFGGNRGRVGTPMQFTASSLNTGYMAMAEKLDLCDIEKVAERLGIRNGKGEVLPVKVPFSILGSGNVPPVLVASAYAAVASGGTYCEPHAIEKIVDQSGKELALPQTDCRKVLSPEVAATAAHALKGVMASGGTGALANPWDGTPVIGKTGTHEQWHTWMVQSSTKVATATWVGNTKGEGDLRYRYYNGLALNNIRYYVSRDIQRVVDKAYKGEAFPKADPKLIRVEYVSLPDVTGMSIKDATALLGARGFDVKVGDAVDSDQPKGMVAEQSPGAGRVQEGTPVTLSPSTGKPKGIEVPPVFGTPDQAANRLRQAGFTNIDLVCQAEEGAPSSGEVRSTSPSEGSTVRPDQKITIVYAHPDCGRPQTGNGNDDDSNGRGNNRGRGN